MGAMRVIDDGVGKNDWVVVNGLQRARPGATVTPDRTEMPDQTAENSAAPPTTDATAQAKPAAVTKPETKAAATNPPPAPETTAVEQKEKAPTANTGKDDTKSN